MEDIRFLFLFAIVGSPCPRLPAVSSVCAVFVHALPYTMPLSSPSKDEWIERLRPLLTRSLDDLSERLTSHPSIQSWLHDASFDAAQSMKGMADMQAQAQAHGRMLDSLTAHFPALVEAVDAMTHECGSLDLHWRPLEPNYSRVYIAFNRSFDVDLCFPIALLSRDAVDDAFQAVEDALPTGTPFPKRPNTATGLIVHHGTGVGVRYSDRVTENDQRLRRVTLLATDRPPLENVPPSDAATALLNYLDAKASTA